MKSCFPLMLALSVASCGPMRSSMISHTALVEGRDATWFAADGWVALQTRDPMGGVLVVNAPFLDRSRVVLSGGIASSGAAMVRTHCYDLSALDLGEGWAERLVWLEPDDSSFVRVDAVTGADAEEAVTLCSQRTRVTSAGGTRVGATR